jgi:hypothetical protein
MAHGDGASKPIVWSSDAPSAPTDPDLERDLRRFCDRGGDVTPEISRDVSFWLDLGREPREVAHWLRLELESGRKEAGEAGTPSSPEGDLPFPEEGNAADTGRSPSRRRARTHPVRRVFRHGAAS